MFDAMNNNARVTINPDSIYVYDKNTNGIVRLMNINNAIISLKYDYIDNTTWELNMTGNGYPLVAMLKPECEELTEEEILSVFE